VLPTVGAYKPSRDVIDRRIVKSVRDRTGTYRVNTSGPWPDLAAGAPAPPPDSDHDGMPDAWEKAHGLDPNNDDDGATLSPNGYTNLENYLNELAGDPILQPKRDESNLMSVCTSPDVQDFTRKAADGPRRMIRRPGWSTFRK
jgi:hypothetical protein